MFCSGVQGLPTGGAHFNYLKLPAGKQGSSIIEIVNEVESDRDDLMADFVDIITSFCAHLYGLRRSKRKTEKIMAQLKENND